MPDLCGLPDELLLAVVNYLRGDGNTFGAGYSDLRYLALTCRKLRPIAQEVLHPEVIVINGVLSTTLTRLFIQADLRVFKRDQGLPVQSIHTYFIKTIRCLTNLTQPFIQIGGPVNVYALPQVFWAPITSKLESCSITDLTLGFDDVPDQLAYNSGLAARVLEYVHDLGPTTSFPSLPNLRNFTAPQEAFFSTDKNFKTCDLPATIEGIGIIDSTCEAKRYIKYVLENQAKWPDLKLVKLVKGTYDNLYQIPDLSYVEDANESDGVEWRQHFQMDDSIYDRAKSCGMYVEKVQDKNVWKKGWDDLDP